MTDASSQSRIKTELKIPCPTVLRLILDLFPEIADDAQIVQAWAAGGSVEFTVEHTVQPLKQAGPILLAQPDPLDPNGEVEDGETTET